MTEYEATQQQRYIERQIRRWKRENAAMQAAGLDTSESAAKIRSWQERQKDFLKQTGLKRQAEREQIGGAFGIEKSTESAIIKSNTAKNGEATLHELGKLDIRKYQCVVKEIATDEVIITEERIAHIRERHPNDYERFQLYLPRIIADPDYIIADERPNTAMVLKEIEEVGEHFRLALRLVTHSDNPSYKNSVITFLKIREKEWRRLIKNKTILYKKE